MSAKVQNWRKLGQIITPEKVNRDWMVNYAMDPTVDQIGEDLFRVYFSGRNPDNQSLVGYVEFDINDPHTLTAAAIEPALSLGELGAFDDNGVTPSCIINHEGRKLLYYIGWKPRSTTRFGLMTGLAESTDGGQSFQRYSRAPVLSLTDKEPFSILTAPYVMVDEGIWKIWYVSCTEWVEPDLPRYNLKYAESEDGIHWKQEGHIALDYQDENEFALARPCIIKENGIYRMWYCFKYAENPYRMGYAESKDGKTFERMDNCVGLLASEDGWDSEMIEYPQVFSHKGKKYMLYNGNSYGMHGAGLAILDNE